MNVRTSDGATISIEAVGGKVEIEYEYAGSKGSLSLVLSHARSLASGIDAVMTKYGQFLMMDKSVAKRVPDIQAFAKAFKQVAG
jgi:hypothetical protein